MLLFEEVIFSPTLESNKGSGNPPGKSIVGRRKQCKCSRYPGRLEVGGGATLHRAVKILCLFCVIGDNYSILN